jgi:hypothetical protein
MLRKVLKFGFFAPFGFANVAIAQVFQRGIVQPNDRNLRVLALIVEALELAPRERRVQRDVRVLQQELALRGDGLFDDAGVDAMRFARRRVRGVLLRVRRVFFRTTAPANVLDALVGRKSTKHHVFAHSAKVHGVLCYCFFFYSFLGFGVFVGPFIPLRTRNGFV